MGASPSGTTSEKRRIGTDEVAVDSLVAELRRNETGYYGATHAIRRATQ